MQIIAINQDTDTCSCCGKRDLKRVVWIKADAESDPVAHGTGCAAVAMGWSRKRGATANWKHEIVASAMKIEDEKRFENWLAKMEPAQQVIERAKHIARVARRNQVGY